MILSLTWLHILGARRITCQKVRRGGGLVDEIFTYELIIGLG